MARFRPLALSAIILGLVTLAAFGVHEVIVGQEAPTLQPISDEQRELLEEEADPRAREAVQQFIDLGGDPCSVPLREVLAEFDAPYSDVDSLINAADLIVTGHPIDNVLESPEPHTLGGGMLSTIQVDDVLYGSASTPTITVEDGNGVIQSGGKLIRYTASGLDSCTAGRALLFLGRTARPGILRIISYQGWTRIEGAAVEAATHNDILQGYPKAAALLDAVREIAQEQQAQGLPKGLLLCRDKWAPLNVCPGDTFNPYQALKLASVDEAFVVTTDPGPSPLGLARADLAHPAAHSYQPS